MNSKIKKVLRSIAGLIIGFSIALNIFVAVYFLTPPNTDYSYKFLNNIFAWKLNQFAKEPESELRFYALDTTRSCETELCKVEKIFYALANRTYYSHVAFGGSHIYKPIETFYFRSGDCKNLSYLFTAIVAQIGIEVKTYCSDTHCWNVYEDKAYDLSVDNVKNQSIYVEFYKGIENGS